MAFYFNQYILNMVYDTEYAYSLLDEQYKEKRFENYEEFENYVKEEMNYIERSILMKYQIEDFGEYKEYVCRDNYNNYYIFKETDPMKYTVLLDQYTIEDEVFQEEYQKQDDSVKAHMNIDKFNQMINRKDLKSAYDVLNEDFKEKYFAEFSTFEEYISKNLFKFNKFEYIEYSEKNGVYTVKTKIKDETLEENNEDIVKRFKVEISKENANSFYISFDI